MITDHKWSLAATDPLVGKLIAYAKTVLDACGIEFGASHTEIRLTKRGPALIETASRMMGASLEPEPFVEAFGGTQARFLAKTVLS